LLSGLWRNKKTRFLSHATHSLDPPNACELAFSTLSFVHVIKFYVEGLYTDLSGFYGQKRCSSAQGGVAEQSEAAGRDHSWRRKIIDFAIRPFYSCVVRYLLPEGACEWERLEEVARRGFQQTEGVAGRSQQEFEGIAQEARKGLKDKLCAPLLLQLLPVILAAFLDPEVVLTMPELTTPLSIETAFDRGLVEMIKPRSKGSGRPWRKTYRFVNKPDSRSVDQGGCALLLMPCFCIRGVEQPKQGLFLTWEEARKGCRESRPRACKN